MSLSQFWGEFCSLVWVMPCKTLLASPKRARWSRSTLDICRSPSCCCTQAQSWSCSRFLFRLMGALEGRVCLLASLLPMAVLLCSPDSGDVKKLQDHLVYLLGWQGIFPHSVFSSVLSHLIDPSGGAFVTCLGRHVSKYNRLACWKIFPDMKPTLLLV